MRKLHPYLLPILSCIQDSWTAIYQKDTEEQGKHGKTEFFKGDGLYLRCKLLSFSLEEKGFKFSKTSVLIGKFSPKSS